MKIYTKKGDDGETQLLGGSIVDKNHPKLESYGNIDELNAFIGNIYDDEISIHQKSILLKIQNQLFNLGSIIAFDGTKQDIKLPKITLENVEMLEHEIDKMEDNLDVLKSFILPSGNLTYSKCHIARTVCRRAERSLVSLSKTSEIESLHLKYLNRLSDYLFVLSRSILKENNTEETEWQKD